MVALDTALRLEYGNGHSLLGLPFGVGSLLDELASAANRAGCDRIIVLCSEAKIAHLAVGRDSPMAVTPMTSQQFSNHLEMMEPADYLLIVDPRAWPAVGYDFEAVVRQSCTYRGAIHALSIGSNPGAYREQIDCDQAGQIRRVQRLYSMMTWPEAEESVQLCSLVPAWALRGSRLGRLCELRSQLMTAGVFTHDIPVPSDVFDLRSEDGLLALSERIAIATVGGQVRQGWSRPRPGVLMGADCRIHPSCRLLGPLVIHSGATVNSGVSIIGPTVIGRACRIQRDAFISHAVIAGGTTVPTRTVVTRRVVGGSLVADREYAGPVPNGDSAEPDLEREVCQAPSELHCSKRLQFAAKRLFDMGFSAAVLVLLSPLLIAVAVLIKWKSPGSIFFVHRRERKDEKGDFPCFKFRTMVSDAHRRQRDLYQDNQVDGPQFKIDSDSRITPLGHFLRTTNIDELPQLFNVLLGHMSLVGPRPSPFRENQICVPWRRARLSVRPGITGLWQLCRTDRQSGDFHQWIYYDMIYVRNFSLWLDLKILALTIWSQGGRKRVSLERLINPERCSVDVGTDSGT